MTFLRFSLLHASLAALGMAAVAVVFVIVVAILETVGLGWLSHVALLALLCWWMVGWVMRPPSEDVRT